MSLNTYIGHLDTRDRTGSKAGKSGTPKIAA